MQTQEHVLAVLAAGNEQVSFSPVQIQKLFFLLDQEIPDSIEGPHFNFQPYDFGPFDKTVYSRLDRLVSAGDVEKVSDSSYRRYRLTPKGSAKGRELLATYPEDVRNYIAEISNWVRSLTFSQLVSAIYREYPEMKTKSVFQQE